MVCQNAPAITLIVLATGFYFIHSTERTFADII